MDKSFNIDRKMPWLLLIGVILVSTNLRAPLTAVGSLITFIRDDLGMSNALAGSLTTLPLLAFALVSPFAPKIANRIGMEWTIFLSIIVLLLGTMIRAVTGISYLFLGTLFIGVAIAIGNVLIPAIIKINFPLKIGLMTGIYAIFMNVFGALGSGLSVPLSNIGSLGWKGALFVWGILAIIALIVWFPQLLGKKTAKEVKVQKGERGGLWRSRLAWQVTLFMGAQSFHYYTLVTWMPDIIQTKGHDAAMAGWVLFIMLFALIPCTFIIPIIAEKMRNQVMLAAVTAIAFIVGIVSLLLGGTVMIFFAAVILGLACGSAFSLSMMFFTLRTKNGKEAAELSGMAQSFGYLLAAVGPVLIGAVQDMTGSWTVPLLLMVGVAVIILVNGVSAGRDGYVVGE